MKHCKDCKYYRREEEKEAILDFLWKKFSKDLFRVATSGFPQWYKERLLKKSMEP